MAALLDDAIFSSNAYDDDDDDDDVIEVHGGSSTAPRQQTLEEMLRPAAISSSRQSHSATERIAARRSQRPRTRFSPPRRGAPNSFPRLDDYASHLSANPRPPPAAAPASATFIDLTAEDSPPESSRMSQTPASQLSQNSRNPRRSRPIRNSTPSLARSDNMTFTAANFIDLTEDSPPATTQAHVPPPLQQVNRGILGSRGNPLRRIQDELMSLEFMHNRRFHRSVTNFTHMITGNLAAGLDIRPFVFQASEHSFHQPVPSPKPPIEPTPRTRPGFTRNTSVEGSDDEEKVDKSEASIAICPACLVELAYDPSDGPVSTTSGRVPKRRKRAPGEHHFWALKKCGHVSAV